MRRLGIPSPCKQGHVAPTTVLGRMARVLVVCGLALASPAWAATGNASPGFAVVELFTSEGCSSCPAADRLLGQILSDARRQGRRVFPLAFHVDYWNRLGWRDPFSDAAYTSRQEEYSRALRAASLYTPQMVVNGQAEFVGSSRDQAQRSIQAALARAPRIDLSLQLASSADGSVVANYETSPVVPGTSLQVALVERGLVSQVRRGENSGRELRHENVVRSFETQNVQPGGRGRIELRMPAGVSRARTSLIVFVQDPKSMQILGAGAADLLPAPTASR